MMIAGCLNQARRIYSKFDDVLFGPAPEAQIECAHKAIREFLCSEEGKPFVSEEFLCKLNSAEQENVANCDNFIKKVIGMVPPIIPLALRNRTLDGGYFRRALLFLGVAEILFKQYEADIRGQANPAGLVGMCSSMHSEFERCTLFNEELSSLKKSMSDMKAQYQTSLGLGSPFRKDSNSRAKRQAKRSRRRPYSRMQSYDTQEVARAQLPYPNFGNQAFASGGLQNSRGRGRGRTSTAPSRGRGPCYAFQAGECNRGRACRFSHLGG